MFRYLIDTPYEELNLRLNVPLSKGDHLEIGVMTYEVVKVVHQIPNKVHSKTKAIVRNV